MIEVEKIRNLLCIKSMAIYALKDDLEKICSQIIESCELLDAQGENAISLKELGGAESKHGLQHSAAKLSNISDQVGVVAADFCEIVKKLQ